MQAKAPRGMVIPWLAFLLMLALTIGLGVWQMQRKVWKENLIATVEQRATGAPASIADIPRDRVNALGDNEYRRVRMRGEFVHACEFHLFTPMRNGAGFVIITAFRRDGDDVPRDLVIRGIVPEPLRAADRRAAGQVAGPVEITGRLRADHLKGSSFVPANEPAKNLWYSRDLTEMTATRCGGLDPARAPAFFVEYDGPPPPGGWPKPEPDSIQLRNDHLQYALTWFALAAVLVGMFAYWLGVQRRDRQAGAAR